MFYNLLINLIGIEIKINNNANVKVEKLKNMFLLSIHNLLQQKKLN